MNIRRFITGSIFLYKPFYRLIAIAVTVAVAVIVGSLVVGDSVRSTLVGRVAERLGTTETVIFSQHSFLDDAILENPVLKDCSRGVLLSNGFVSVSGRLIPVMVWGTDGHGVQRGRAKINEALLNEIKPSRTAGEAIVLRLPAAGMVPLGSMFVTDTYTTSLRLELDSVIPVSEGGNINLRNEQTIPFNIFVNRAELAEIMDVSGKVNVILSDRMISTADFASAWNYEFSGLNVEAENGVTTVTSDRIFIRDKVVQTLCADDPASDRLYVYLANSIRRNGISIPYSFITAADHFQGEPLQPHEIILSDYAARRLNARLGDTISVSYFISRQFKTLTVDSVFLKVGRIVPLADLQADRLLRADFPGLSNVERCTDWNSDLPIDIKQITDEDEDFWRKHKNTPKAIAPYSTLAPRWENAFGSATALRIGGDAADRLEKLTNEMFSIEVIHPREAGLTAARSGVDFAGLFLSLGFFIIISAVMLMMVPLSEMLFRRRGEIGLLKATGFAKKRILQMLRREAAPVVCLSAIAGVIVGLAYTYVILFLLGSVWKGATHTEGFRAYPDLITVAAGMISGIILSLSFLYIGITRSFKKKADRKKRTDRLISPLIYSVIFAGTLTVNIFFVQSPLLFIFAGAVFLFTAWSWMDYLIRRRGTSAKKPVEFLKLVWSSLFYTRRQAMLSFVTLASGVFILFSVGLNRQGFADSSQIQTATGGFALWAETSVPVYHNLQTEEGRAKLGLTDLHEDVQIIQLLKYSADDASCLNLNKVVTPNVLGINMEELAASDFEIIKPIFADADIFKKFRTIHNSAYPALVDETVLQWGLGKKLGDTITYTGENGRQVTIKLAGTLRNSIFQGYILIDKALSTEIWSEISGSEVMLLKVPGDQVDYTKSLVSQALNNYGIRIMTTGQRLKMFYSVTDTYLTIFLTLGGLGLLLGIFSFIIVVRKNILMRLGEIALYRSLGFGEKRMERLLYRENIIIPLCAVSTGALGSLLGVSMGLGNVGIWVWAMAVIFLAVFVLCVTLFVKVSVKNYLRNCF
ncbi:MAG: ABC transporter permease [Rikenellaceae bacterium]|nr:ABC transporter permease [Rikenellaceae bacterium]MCL2692734.1 ABC transporter permease [Rikenellaceae bacterium]